MKFLLRSTQVHLVFLYAASSYIWRQIQRQVPAAMVGETDSCDWRNQRVQEWLLLLLRFAITRQQSDRSAALAMADELDSLGACRPHAPRFFLRTSEGVCEAVLWNGGHDNAVLLTHVSRIDHPRLRAAFRAAVGLQRSLETPSDPNPLQGNPEDENQTK